MNLEMFARTTLVVVLLAATSCASSYKPLDPASFVYTAPYEIKDTLRVSYVQRTQAMTGNKRYDKRERRHNMSSVAIKIENLTDSEIEIRRDNFTISSPSGHKTVYSPTAYAKKVKQWAAIHLLHTLWGPWAISWKEDEHGETDVNFIFIPVGAIVGIGNALKAAKANEVNRTNQEKHQLWNKKILPGSTLYGLVTIPSTTHHDTLYFHYHHAPHRIYQSASAKPYLLPKGPASVPYDFYILLSDGTPVSVKARIESSADGYFIVADNKSNKEIKPEDTRSLSRLTRSGRQLLGKPFGNAWLFHVIEGPINGYYYLAEDQTNVISHLQQEGGPLIPFSPDVLEQMIGGDDQLLKLVKKQKYVQAINEYNAKYR